MNKEKNLIDLLINENIKFTKFDHPPLFTVDESKLLRKNTEGAHTKNLFLKNKKNHFFLLSCKDDTLIDLKKLKRNSIFGNVSFAKENYMKEILDLTPGSVTPFGLLNDQENIVDFYLDDKLLKFDIVNFHPLINTSTIGLKISDFLSFMKIQKKVVKFFNFDNYEVSHGK